MTVNPDTLIVISPGFASDETDSTCLPLQQSLLQMIRKLNPSIEIEILALHYPYRKEKYCWKGIPVHAFHGKKRGRLFRFLLKRQVLKTLDTITRSKRVAGILSFWCGEAALFAKRYADRKGLRHYCWILGQDAKKDNPFIRQLKPAAGELLALSEFIRDSFEINHHIRPAKILLPGIDKTEFGNAALPKTFDIMAAGSLIPLKQYHLLPEIIFALKKEMPDIRAVLCGAGPEKNRILQKAEALGLKDNLVLTGELSHPDVLSVMQQSRVFLHPSSYEGFGMVMPEALYAGCQVISFTVPQKQPVPHWHWVKTSGEMAQKALELLTDPQTAYTPVIPFSIESTAEELIALFDLHGADQVHDAGR